MCRQGLGLFAARDMEKQTMVIEYNGTILRNEVAIRNEMIYRSQVLPLKLFYINLLWCLIKNNTVLLF